MLPAVLIASMPQVRHGTSQVQIQVLRHGITAADHLTVDHPTMTEIRQAAIRVSME
jgi:hypothetical protein